MGDNSAVTIDKWKGQLNFVGVCTSTGPQDRCWLLTDLTAWNRVLYELNYELVETCPGKLSLRYVPSSSANERRLTAKHEIAFLISWLVENHHCIDELRISYAALPKNAVPEYAPARIRLRPPPGKGIRSLGLVKCWAIPCSSSYCYLPDEDMEALQGVEELEVRCCDARLEEGLVKLLRSNSKSLKFVDIVVPQLSMNMVDVLLCLSSCESLRVCYCFYHTSENLWDARATARLLRSLAGVKTFSLLPYEGSQWNVPAVVDAVKGNANLTTLELCMLDSGSSPRELFAALEANASLQALYITSNCIDTSCGDALASALCRNSCLLDLRLDGRVTVGCLEHVAEALSRNATLEKLQFGSVVLGLKGVSALFDALRTNTTLKKLVIPSFQASETDRRMLAQKLSHGDGYSRVQLTCLEDCDMPGLSKLLACPTSGPEQVSWLDIRAISDANVKLLFDALATNVRVRTIKVYIEESPQAKKASLCAMLRANRSLRRINIALMCGEEQFIYDLLSALKENKNISELEISMRQASTEISSALSDFFARNRKITTFSVSVTEPDSDCFVEEVSRGVAVNPVIVEFGTRGNEPYSYLISERLRRNRSALNRAVDFVVLRSNEKSCAEAFERFYGKRCLLDQIMSTSGHTESQALHSIATAENFLRDNYFVITGVVHRSVKCHPVPGGTQFDELNVDCWRAIVRNLKVSDVVG